MKTADDVLSLLRRHLHDMFEVPEGAVVPEARLYEDLDLDSLDAVDLIVKLQEITGKRIAPADFKSVRTVSDVVDKVNRLMAR